MPRSFTPLPWKKGFKKLPPNVEAVLNSASADSRFVVCGEKVISEADLKDHVYCHLNIETENDIPAEFEPFIPSATVGKASFRNTMLVEEVQKHLGFVWKTYSGRAPSRGRFAMHRTHFRRRVRPRRLVPPSMSYLAFKRLSMIPGRGVSVFFEITEVLEPSNRGEIVRCLNLLQENVGVAELRPVETAEAEAVRNLNLSVGWEILRDGEASGALGRVFRRIGGRNSAAGRRAENRLEVLRALKPTRVFLSARGLVGYIAAEFCPRLTVFENLEVDHAMFIAHGPAEEFIGLSRPQLVAKIGGGIDRLVHAKGWREKLRCLVKLARGDQSANPGEMI